jgi:hypothetical protein
MDFVHFGVGPAATLTGFLLFGLSSGPAVVDETCTSLVSYDFTAESAPLYPVASQPGYWHTNVWPGGHPAPEAGFPDLVMAFGAEILGSPSELSYLDDNPRQAAAIFGSATAGPAGYVDSLVDAYGGGIHVYVEVGVNFHAEIFETQLTEPARILGVYPLSIYYESFALFCDDNDGPGSPAGDLVLRLRWCNGAGSTASATVATKARAWADGLHTFRVEMTPSTPLVPGSTSNPTLVSNGVARVYIDGVLEYENTAIQFRTNPAPIAQINDTFDVGAVGLGHRGFVGGYSYLQFGYCEVDEEEPVDPPTPGGQAPEGEEPAASALPVGVTRIMAVLTYGSGSPQSKIKVTETPFFFDPPSWHGGYGHPWLISISDITRELSESVKGTEVTIRVADPEYFFRTLAETEPIAGATWEIFLVSDTVRYALGEPHRRFVGLVHDYRALPDLEFEFVVRDIVSEELGRLADAPLIPPDRLTATKFPGMTADYENRAVPIALGEVSDESETTPQGVVPPLIVAPSMNLTTFGGVNVQVVGAILSHGALPPNGPWQGYFNPVDNPYVRIPIPASAEGTILTWPGAAGWNYVGVATDYIDFPSTPSLTHRYTPVFFLASDPNVQAFVDGRIQVAFNVYGVTDEPDGSGLYFSDAPDIYEFILRNYLYQPHWRYGAYNEMPTFVGGYSFIDHASIVRTRDRLRGFSGTSPAAYPVGFLLGRNGQQQTLKHVLNELCHGVLMDQGIDRHGRILLDVEDVDAVATLSLTDLLDITDGFTVRIDRASYRNNAEEVHGYRYLPAVAPLPAPPEGETLPPANVGPHNDWSAVVSYTHDDAVTANRGRLTASLKIENFVVRNSDVALNRVQREIARLVGPAPTYDGQRRFTLTTSWQALDVELGDVIAIDHLDGLGASGFVDRRARVLKIVDNLQDATITLEGRVLYSEGSPA